MNTTSSTVLPQCKKIIRAEKRFIFEIVHARTDHIVDLAPIYYVVLLAAWPGGPAACAARSSGFFSSIPKSSTLATGVSSEHFARRLGPASEFEERASELLTQRR